MPREDGQFKKGNQSAKGKGRKGYEWEDKQLKQMKELTTGALKLSKKIQEGKAKPEEIKRFLILQKLVAKIMDKIHPNKQHIEHDVGADTLEELTKFFRSIPK